MLQDLLEIVQSFDFEEDGRIDIRQAEWVGEDLRLSMQVALGGKTSDTWTVDCSGVVDYLLSHAFNCGLNHWTANHPAISQFTEPYENLYFSAGTNDPNGLLGRLWLAHRKASDDWIPFDRYLNQQMSPKRLFAADQGMMASGPSFLVDAYATVLEQEGMNPRRAPAHDRLHEPGTQMLHFGECYVIAATFSANRASR